MEILERRHFLIILLLALFIHLMILVPLLMQLFGPPLDLKKILEDKKEQVELLKEQAALKPKEALVIPEQQPSMPQPEPQVQEAPEEPEATEEAVENKNEPIPETLPFSEAPGITEPTPTKKIPPEEQKQPKKKKVRKIPRVAGPPQNRATLPNFNQNFVQYMQEGEDEYKRKGNENIRPDLEELKLISYNKKILQFLNGARGMLRSRIMEILKSSKTKRDLVLSFSIGSNGQLMEVETIQTSGSLEVDSIFKELFRAAAPFPKPPVHLNGKPLTLRSHVKKEIMDSAKHGNDTFVFHMDG
jgi:outer membrane biosynthesis protein TonB